MYRYLSFKSGGNFSSPYESSSGANTEINHLRRMSPTSKVWAAAQVWYAMGPPGGTSHPKSSPTTCVVCAPEDRTRRAATATMARKISLYIFLDIFLPLRNSLCSSCCDASVLFLMSGLGLRLILFIELVFELLEGKEELTYIKSSLKTL